MKSCPGLQDDQDEGCKVWNAGSRVVVRSGCVRAVLRLF
jgi:hypothetical protein